MMSFLSENRPPALVVMILVASLLLLSYQVRIPDAAGSVQSVLLTLVSPVTRASAGIMGGVRGGWQNYIALRDQQEENLALRRRLVHLEVENQLLGESAREGARLRDLMALKAESSRETVAARVISLEVSGPFRVAILNRGHSHGVSVDDGVITPSGVVGRITATAAGISKVQLLTDPSSGVASLVERTRVQGMVVGRGVNRVEMQYVSALADVEPGDAIQTSSLEGIYPAGLPVGRVIRVGDAEGLQRRIEIATAVDFRTLEEVLVLLAPEAADEAAAEAP